MTSSLGEGREPVLRVPEERTALPDVDRAMPVLETIAAAVSRKRGRFNVAVLKSLQESGSGRWKIKEIQDALDWLEPQSATDLVSGLRASEILRYDNLANRYSMPPEVRGRISSREMDYTDTQLRAALPAELQEVLPDEVVERLADLSGQPDAVIEVALSALPLGYWAVLQAYDVLASDKPGPQTPFVRPR